MGAEHTRIPEEQFDGVLAASQTGAGWAFDLLYRSLAPAVVAYLRLQGVEDAEDLSSEVFLGAFRGLERFSGDQEAFRSWVFTIAHRRVVDDRRRRSRRPVSDPSADGIDEVEAASDTETEVLASLDEAQVRRLCGLLPPDQRDVVLLRLIGDMSLRATADALDKTPGAVKALQRRGVAGLKGLLIGETSREAVSR